MRALVLSGGGCKGAFQVGALRALMARRSLDYEIVVGVSVGALNAAAIAEWPVGRHEAALASLQAMWLSLDTRKVWRRRWCGDVLAAAFCESIRDASPLEAFVRSRLDPKMLSTSGRELRVGAVSLSDGEYHVADQHDPEIVDWVLASSAFPAFFPPRQIGRRMWSDGGLRNVTPIGEAIRAGAEEIDVVMCSNPDHSTGWEPIGRRAFEYALRSVDLLADEVVRNDLQVAGLKNDLAEPGGKYRSVKIRVVQPSVVLSDDPLDFSPRLIRAMMSQGHVDGVRALSE